MKKSISERLAYVASKTMAYIDVLGVMSRKQFLRSYRAMSDNIFMIVAVGACFVILSIICGIVIYGVAIDWDSISGIVLGIYLYQAYLLFRIIWGEPKNQRQSSRGNFSMPLSKESYKPLAPRKSFYAPL